VVAAADRPAVQESWHDANAYEVWLSNRTGERYRLPTDEEWAFAAGSKFADDALPVDEDDPSKRWIAKYERESERTAGAKDARAFGHFGVNENGLADLAAMLGMDLDLLHYRLDDAGETIEQANCGVRVVEGQHRSYVTDFIRDARAGGGAPGVPPDNLGFAWCASRGHQPRQQSAAHRADLNTACGWSAKISRARVSIRYVFVCISYAR
jgi:hypothetical protein